jgi:hypothetical protein
MKRATVGVGIVLLGFAQVARAQMDPAPAEATIEQPSVAPPVGSRWQTTLYGFVELDAMHDTTQSYASSANNAMLARPGTYAGTQPRAQLTAQNSLLGLRVAAPDHGRLRASSHLEIDFFGVPTADATEQTIYTVPTVRMRLYYLKLETPAVDVVAGQYHDLFGWGGAGFYPASVAFLGLPGEIYRRQPQLRVSRTFVAREVTLDVALAAVRPVQRDAGVPDLQSGIKVSVPGWRGATAQGFGQPDVAPLAIGISAVGRRFAVAEFLPNPGDAKVALGGGLAVDLFVPILRGRGRARDPGDRGNALSLTAEATIGTGIADLYTGLSGGALFPTLPNPGALVPPPLYRPNIDPGIVTYDANANLRTITWRAVLIGLQYYLPIAGGRMWASVNVSRLESPNLRTLTPEASRGGVFVRQEYVDANLFGAVTPAVQLGASFQATRQRFGDMPFGNPSGPEAVNLRGEIAARMFF